MLRTLLRVSRGTTRRRAPRNVPTTRSPSMVERVVVHAHAGTGTARGTGDVAVLAVAATDLVGGRDERAPHARRRALRDRLPLRRLSPARVGERAERLLGQVTTELRDDRARVHRAGALPRGATAPVELHREQHVGGLRASVRLPRVVRRAFEVDVVEHDVAEAVAGRGEV